MPGFNRKGPQGDGPMTGRSMGKCGNKQGNRMNGPANNDAPNENNGDQQQMSPMFRNRGRGRQRCQSNGGGFGGRRGRFSTDK